MDQVLGAASIRVLQVTWLRRYLDWVADLHMNGFLGRLSVFEVDQSAQEIS